MKRIGLKKTECGSRCGPYIGLLVGLVLAGASVGVGADGPTCVPTTRAAATQEATTRETASKPRVLKAQELWVGEFSQCSYNAVSSVLTYFYGPLGKVTDRKKFESETFNGPLGSMGYGGFYGWGPWTSYMVMSGKMVWNGQTVTTLRADRFSLRTSEQPEMRDKLILVHYLAGERERLEQKLLKKLEIGPVVMWTCYAGVQDAQFETPWHHVSRIDDHTDAVPFGPFTHSVTLYLVAADPTKKGQEPGADEPHVLVADCSVKNGLFVTDLDAIVSTSSAMTTFMRASGQLNPSGIINEEYNVVFYQSSTTRPAALTDEDDTKVAGEAEVLASLKAEDRGPLETALEKSRSQRTQWVAALRKVPTEQRDGLVFLLVNMPERDLVSLDPDFVLEDVALAYKARAEQPWGKEIPEEVFSNDVLPYANVNEDRDHWRPDFVNRFTPQVKDCKTASEAALKINSVLFREVDVKYHATKRPKPDQSPSESIGAGYASCTGLSILLADGCRAVGVPARLVGIPAWVVPAGQEAGNHTWVEIWDGQWHVLPAAEGSSLDGGWFMQAASLALEGLSRKDNMDHHIYAATWRDTGTPFRLVWDEMINYVHAEDVTADYAGRTVVKIKAGSADQPAHLVLRLKGRLVADLDVKGETTLILSAGQTYSAQVAGKTVAFVSPEGKDMVVELPGDGNVK